jgi:hypothetical protein
VAARRRRLVGPHPRLSLPALDSGSPAPVRSGRKGGSLLGGDVEGEEEIRVREREELEINKMRERSEPETS